MHRTCLINFEVADRSRPICPGAFRENRVMRRHPVVQAPHRPASTPSAAGVLQRKCGCGRHRPGGGQCSACRKNKKKHPAVQRAATAAAPAHAVPASVADVLRSPGRPLDSATRRVLRAPLRARLQPGPGPHRHPGGGIGAGGPLPGLRRGARHRLRVRTVRAGDPERGDCSRTSWPTWCSKARPVGCRGP